MKTFPDRTTICLSSVENAPFQHHGCTISPPVGGSNASSRARGVNSSTEFHFHTIIIPSHFNREKIYNYFR